MNEIPMHTFLKISGETSPCHNSQRLDFSYGYYPDADCSATRWIASKTVVKCRDSLALWQERVSRQADLHMSIVKRLSATDHEYSYGEADYVRSVHMSGGEKNVCHSAVNNGYFDKHF